MKNLSKLSHVIYIEIENSVHNVQHRVFMQRLGSKERIICPRDPDYRHGRVWIHIHIAVNGWTRIKPRMSPHKCEEPDQGP